MKLVGDKKGFDQAMPSSGHEARFERKLEDAFGSKRTEFPWLKFAASLLVIVSVAGILYFTETNNDPGIIEIADKERKEIPIKEAEQYYKQSFQKQFDLIASTNTSVEGKMMIEESQALISQLDEQYQKLEEELKITGDQRVAAAMINNYKSRIKILETLVQKLTYVNHLKEGNYESNAL